MRPDPRRAAAALLAAALIALPLLLAQAAARGAPAFPLELPLVLLLIAGAPVAARAPLRAGVAAALAALLALALLDLATAAALGRRFNPVLDLPLVAAGWRLVAGSVGGALAAAAAAATAALLALTAAALWWATGRPATGPRPLLIALALPALALAAADAGRAFDPPGSAAATRLAWEHLRDGWRARGDLARFRAEAAADAWAEAPADRILPALAGRDVFLVFVESYGRSAHENPLYAPTVTATLGDAEARLAAAGLAARSALAHLAGGRRPELAGACDAALGARHRQRGPLPRPAGEPAPQPHAPRRGRRLAHRGGDAGDHPALARGRLVRLRHRARGQGPRLPRPAVQLGDDARPVHPRRPRAPPARRRAPPAGLRRGRADLLACPLDPDPAAAALGRARRRRGLRSVSPPPATRPRWSGATPTGCAPSTASRSTTRSAPPWPSPSAAPPPGRSSSSSATTSPRPSSPATPTAATCRCT